MSMENLLTNELSNFEVLYSSEQISKRVKELGEEITEYYKSIGCNELVCVCVLQGAMPFFVELTQNIAIEGVIQDTVRVSSYGNGTTSGKLEFKKGLDVDIEGKHVLIIEDLIETGQSLEFLIQYCQELNPLSVQIVVLLDKYEKHGDAVTLDYVGFRCEDHFVIGYGLDYAMKYRHLPFIGYKTS
ncbi:hypothetical protein PCE1_002891 [Barthelona sp. PCE]